MAKKYKSNGSFAGNWEVQIQKPLDDRQVVATYNDLLDAATWRGKDNNYYHYTGMSVTVAATGDIYTYIGESGSTTAVANAANWKLSSGDTDSIVMKGTTPDQGHSDANTLQSILEGIIETAEADPEVELTSYVPSTGMVPATPDADEVYVEKGSTLTTNTFTARFTKGTGKVFDTEGSHSFKLGSVTFNNVTATQVGTTGNYTLKLSSAESGGASYTFSTDTTLEVTAAWKGDGISHEVHASDGLDFTKTIQYATTDTGSAKTTVAVKVVDPVLYVQNYTATLGESDTIASYFESHAATAFNAKYIGPTGKSFDINSRVSVVPNLIAVAIPVDVIGSGVPSIVNLGTGFQEGANWVLKATATTINSVSYKIFYWYNNSGFKTATTYRVTVG